MSEPPKIVKGPFELDGKPGHYQVRCPRCGFVGVVDPDQAAGRVSIRCGYADCNYHETHDIRVAEDRTRTMRG